MTQQLTTEQCDAASTVVARVNAGHLETTVGGLAGTGKTVLASRLAEMLGAIVVAPTGKAACVLRNKGIQAETIHSLAMRLVRVKQARDKDGNVIEMPKPEFVERGVLTSSPIIVDESSMVDRKCYDALIRFNVPIVWVGDYGQLRPVGEDPGIMDDPDIVLKEQHRQAKDSPIIRAAMAVRKSGSLNGDAFGTDRGLRVVHFGSGIIREAVAMCEGENVDQIICANNDVRRMLNAEYRRAIGMTDEVCFGDRLVCLLNRRMLGMFNGMIFTVTAVNGDVDKYRLSVDLIDEYGIRRRNIHIWRPSLGGGVWDNNSVGWTDAVVDFGYAVTCHKAQGSEWKSVCVLDDVRHDPKRWRYTAYTRARGNLIVVQ